MVTPQGQQVVVTQVPRPILQQSTVTNNIVPVSTLVKTITNPVVTPTTAVTTTITTNLSQKQQQLDKKTTNVTEETKPPVVVVKTKIIRDLTTPFVCEWGDCQV